MLMSTLAPEKINTTVEPRMAERRAQAPFKTAGIRIRNPYRQNTRQLTKHGHFAEAAGVSMLLPVRFHTTKTHS